MAESGSTVALSIGGIGLRLECGQAELAEKLARRYRHFPLEGEVYFEARLAAGPSRGDGLTPGAGVDFRQGVLQFTDPGYAGRIDPQRGVGELALSSDHLVEGADYYLRAACALLAFQRGGFLFHAAGILRGDCVYLFFGHSGSGKTTVARLSGRDVVLNDDLMLLLPDEASWMAHATPFWNPSQVQPTRQCAPPAGLYRLEQSQRVALEPLSRGEALAEWAASVPVISSDPGRSGELLGRGLRFLQAVPAYRLCFLPDASFWQVVDP